MHRQQAGFALSLVGDDGKGGESSSGSHRSHARPSGSGHSSRRTTAPLSRNEAFGDEEDGDDDDDNNVVVRGHHPSVARRNGRRGGAGDEALLGYSRSGAEPKDRKEPVKIAPRVITKQEDANWMEERKRRLGLDRYRQELGSLAGMGGGRVAAVQGKAGVVVPEVDRIGDGQELSGLQVRRQVAMDGGDTEMAESEQDRERTPSLSQAGNSPPPLQEHSSEGQSLDDEDAAARAALMTGSLRGTSGAGYDRTIAPVSEEEALQRDMDTRPEAPNLDDYAKMPVEEFGAALLRGMGWKEGMGAGRQRQGPIAAPEVKKRVALLGLGAKERARDPEDEVGKARTGRSSHRTEKPERRYVPLIRRPNGSDAVSSAATSPAPRRERSDSPSSRQQRQSFDAKEEEARRRHRDRRRGEDRDRHEARYDSESRKREDRGHKDDRRTDQHGRHGESMRYDDSRRRERDSDRYSYREHGGYRDRDRACGHDERPKRP